MAFLTVYRKPSNQDNSQGEQESKREFIDTINIFKNKYYFEILDGQLAGRSVYLEVDDNVVEQLVEDFEDWGYACEEEN